MKHNDHSVHTILKFKINQNNNTNHSDKCIKIEYTVYLAFDPSISEVLMRAALLG